MAKTPAWQRSEGKNPSGGLNEKGRASLRAAGHDIKRPQPEGGSRKDSFCARMKGMKAKLTSSETANDPDSRINKSLRKWKCADGGALEVARKYKDAGGRIYRQNKSPWQRESDTTPRSMSPMTQKYPGSDITPEISKDQYRKGKLGKDDYALSKGGAASYRKPRASGGKARGYVIPQFNSDAEALAAMMWSEADIFRGRPDQQEAIVGTGWSAKNRALAGFPEGMPASYRNTHDVHSIKDQITNPGGSGYGAYSYFNKTRANMAQKAFEKDPAVRDYYLELANNIINGTIEDPTQGAMSYYNPQATKGTPGWAGKKGKELGWYETVKDEKGKGGSHVYFGNNDYTPKALAAQKQEADALAQRATPRSRAGDFTPKNPPPVQTPDETSQNAFFQKYLYGSDPDYENFEGDVDFDTSAIKDMYNQYYGRQPVEAEVSYLKDALDNGTLDIGNLQQYVSTSPEAQQYANTSLDKLYNQNYGRNATDAEKSYLNNAINAGTLTRENLAAYLPTTQEAKDFAAKGAQAASPSVTSLSSLPKNSTVFIQGNPYFITTPEEAAKMKANGTLPKNVMYASGLQSLGINNLIGTGSNEFGGTHYVAYTPQTAAQYGLTYSAKPTTTPSQTSFASSQQTTPNLGQQLAQSGAGGNIGAGGTATAPGYTGITPTPSPDMTQGGLPSGGGTTSGYYNQPQPTFVSTSGERYDQSMAAKGWVKDPVQGYWLPPSDVSGTAPTGSPNFSVTPMKSKRGGRIESRAKGGALSDAMSVARCYKKGGPVWDKPRPKSLGKPEHLSSSQKSSAKAMAKAAGRPYPNLVDNMRAAKKG